MIELSSSQEDYLEAILNLSEEHGVARAREISDRLKVTRSAVTRALRMLTEKKLIDYEPYGYITLTAEGAKRAADVVRRHKALKNFLSKVLLVEDAEAEETACKLEHAVSKVVVDRIIKFVEYVETCPHSSTRWLDGFGFHCSNPVSGETCTHCERRLDDRDKQSEQEED